MEKIKLEGLNELVFYEKLDNGLDVYVLRKEKFNYFSAYFVTNYGALIDKFIPINENDVHHVPNGIAHFLEHKLFEQEKGPTVLEKFAEIGGVCNASTNYDFTTYYVEGTDNFYENLNFLLDYVQSPYFTDENVEKEKGIIKQEALMTKDDPYRTFYLKSLDNLFVNYKYGKSIVGSIEDIESITKEDLYRCYDTFYNPSNMCIIVVSNEDEEKVIENIRNNQKNKKFAEIKKIEKEYIYEPENVSKEYEVIYDNVTKSHVSISIKLPFNKFKLDKLKTKLYLQMLLKINFGSISGFGLELKKKNIIDSNIGLDISEYNDYVIASIDLSGEDTDNIIKVVNDKLNNLNLSIENFERIKKCMISDFVYYFTKIDSIMGYLFSDYCNYGKINEDTFMKYKSLSFDELKYVLENFNTSNKSIVVMKPLEKKE